MRTELPTNWEDLNENLWRHICTTEKNVTFPVNAKQSYSRPVYKRYTERCNGNQMCNGVRLVFETTYRDVVNMKTRTQVLYTCCPGWYQVTNRSHGCNKPSCVSKCQNGGTCVKPNTCSCPSGFKGQYCEEDVDECADNKPCDQICHNTMGGFKCECRESFILLGDGQSCRKEDGEELALEAKDLQYEMLDKRLHKLEKTILDNLATISSTQNVEVKKITGHFHSILEDVNVLKVRLRKLEAYSDDISMLKSKLGRLEKFMVKIQGASPNKVAF
ncbi:epidermal growth factor-like protein 8 [Photinus pyralis]|uniref:epidermal growth factor-like protein 8 n=1 Tax=Photinus pyralis TaxID=7054 RepID=UPI001266F426|nr:epidermal growth factor-like protein 8 [Photinus pyralis]